MTVSYDSHSSIFVKSWEIPFAHPRSIHVALVAGVELSYDIDNTRSAFCVTLVLLYEENILQV